MENLERTVLQIMAIVLIAVAGMQIATTAIMLFRNTVQVDMLQSVDFTALQCLPILF